MFGTGYPDNLTLRTFLQSIPPLRGTDCGSDLDSLDIAGALQAAIREFEQRTGWKPFLGVSQVRKFDPPGAVGSPASSLPWADWRGGGRTLLLKSGLLALTSLTVGGTAWSLDTQFHLRPVNADVELSPWTSIEFIQSVFGRAESVVITGIWGYSLACPADVQRAILYKGCAELSPEIALLISGGAQTIREGDVETQYSKATSSARPGGLGHGAMAAQENYWSETFEKAVKRYKRLEL